VQDPGHDDADRTALAELDVTVVDNPRAFIAVDDSTVVFTVNPAVQVRQIVTDLARPAVLIWSRVEGHEHFP
jgi:hypothetical protein